MPKNSEIDALNAMMPARRARAVTPANGTALALGPCDNLYIGVAGDVSVILEDDTAAVLFKAHPVGYLQGRVKSVEATATTATNILALY